MFFVLFCLSCLSAQNKADIELYSLPQMVYNDLIEYVKYYNEKQLPIDEYSSFDPIIHKITNEGYLIGDKYLIPIVKQGSNYSFTIFLLWDQKIIYCFKTNGYAFKKIELTNNINLLKVSYAAGCCDARYYAVGIISTKNDTIRNLFILPYYAYNSIDWADGEEYNFDIAFELISQLGKVCEISIDRYSIEQKYWISKTNSNNRNNITEIRKPDRVCDLFIEMIFNNNDDLIFIESNNDMLSNELENLNSNKMVISPIDLMNLFIGIIRNSE